MRKKLISMAPLAILGMMIFAWIGGEVVMLLWNWLAPALFGLRQITFWQALGLLALCRILFGGFGLSGGQRSKSRQRRRMAERWEQMTPEEREQFRQGLHERSRNTTPLDFAAECMNLVSFNIVVTLKEVKENVLFILRRGCRAGLELL